MMMFLLLSLSLFSSLLLVPAANLPHDRAKRLLPNNKNCNPTIEVCQKGDLIDPKVSDCTFTPSSSLSCTAEKSGGIISWVVAPDKNNRCNPKTDDVKFACGSRGSNTRCVCSDYKIKWNECRCQYWTEETPGENDPGFCTAYYLAGSSGVHHYACCNNCIGKDATKTSKLTCDGVTYQGGSTGSYCGHCGKNLGGGNLKWYFNCHNCTVQSNCEALCNKKVSTLPGFCWKWVDCFKDCCSNISFF